MELKEIQKYVKDLCDNNSWNKESLESRIDYLKSEVQEVIIEIEAYQIADSDEERGKVRTQMGHEIFDVIWNLAEIANRYGIDLSEASRQKIEINSKRKEFSSSPLLK